MKILFTIPTLRQGGAERVMCMLANYFSDKHDVVLAVQDDKKNDAYDLSHKVNRFHINSVFPKLFSIIKLRKTIKDFQPDIIISFLILQNVQTIFASLGLKVPVIISERTCKEFYDTNLKKITSRILFWFYKYATHLVVQTIRVKKQFKSVKNISIISNPVADIPPYETKEKNKIISVSRLIKLKSLDTLILAFAKISPKYPNWSLDIWGDGVQREFLQNLIKSLNLNEKIKLCGSTRDIVSKLKQANIFVFSSKYEGFPNALCEAMMSRLPVIYTNISGSDELIIPNETGLLVERENVEQLAEALIRLINSKTLREYLGDNAKKHVQENFSYEKICLKWEELAQAVVKKRKKQ